MSEPIHDYNIKLINAVSMASDIPQTIGQTIAEDAGYAIQASWSGTAPVGTFNLFGSNDNIIFTLVKATPVSGDTGSILGNVEYPRYSWVAVSYTAGSGTGNLTVTINAKKT